MERRPQLAHIGLRLLTVVCCATALLTLPRSAAAQSARQLLLSSVEPRVTSYVGEQVSNVTPAESTGKTRTRRRTFGHKVYRKGSTLRIEYADGRVLFDNGERQLMYLPRMNVVESGASSFRKELILRQKRFIQSPKTTVEQLSDETIAGRAAYVLLVRRANMERRVWVDKHTGVQLRQDVTNAKGRTISTYFRSISFQDPPEEKLAFTPPPGVPVVDRGHGRPLSKEDAATLAKGWGGLLTPTAMPAGYTLRGYFRHEFRSQPLLVAVYAHPRRKGTVSVFQGAIRGMNPMNDRQPGNLRVMGGRKGNADVLIIGPLSEDEMERVLNSLSPE